jgi:hypothetical protein
MSFDPNNPTGSNEPLHEDPLSSAAMDGDEDGILPDVLRRAIQSGFRTVRWGEESIRGIATDLLQNERVEAVGSTIKDLREDLVRVVGREFIRYLDQLNLTDEVVKVLTAISLEVKTEIRFIPNDKKLVTPNVKTSMNVKSKRPKAAAKKKASSRRRPATRKRAKKKKAPSEPKS